MIERKSFLMKPKHQCHLPQWEEWVYGAQSWKERGLLYEFMIVLIDKWTLTLKNNGRRSFSYETKASISFIPIQRMTLWCPIMKTKEIIMWIHVCPNWPKNFNSKEWCKEKLFLWNQSNNVIYPNEEDEFIVSKREKKRDYYVDPYLS